MNSPRKNETEEGVTEEGAAAVAVRRSTQDLPGWSPGIRLLRQHHP